MQIKITMSYHFTRVEMTTTKKKKITNVGKGVEKL